MLSNKLLPQLSGSILILAAVLFTSSLGCSEGPNNEKPRILKKDPDGVASSKATGKGGGKGGKSSRAAGKGKR